MNILYKYCDQLGAVKILDSLELKLSYVVDVNDPLECKPVFHCGGNFNHIKNRYIARCSQEGVSFSVENIAKLRGKFDNGELQKELLDAIPREWGKIIQDACLLSVSANNRNTVMWAHYADKHKGIVIGIDFDIVYRSGSGVKMLRVNYSPDRPQVNIFEDDLKDSSGKVLSTKFDGWGYENEFRCIFDISLLEKMEKSGFSRLGNLDERETWFLRLNPMSIREVIFGLYTEKALKASIKEIIDCSELRHTKLYQVKESKTYEFEISEA